VGDRFKTGHATGAAPATRVLHNLDLQGERRMMMFRNKLKLLCMIIMLLFQLLLLFNISIVRKYRRFNFLYKIKLHFLYTTSISIYFLNS